MAPEPRRQPKKPKKPHPQPIPMPPAITPDFTSQCYFTMQVYCCTHKYWLKDPKITHVGHCPMKSHKSRCDNMAKGTREVMIEGQCPRCVEEMVSGAKVERRLTDVGLDRKVYMVEAVRRRIRELEEEEKRGGNGHGVERVRSGPEKLLMVDELSRGLVEEKNFQRLPVAITKDGFQDAKANSETTDAAPQPAPTGKIPSVKDDTESEEGDYRSAKASQNPSTAALRKQVIIVTEQPKGILRWLSWKTTPVFAESSSSDEELWEDDKEWVYITSDIREK